MEYYSDAKENEIKKFTGKCMDLETIIINEVTQIPKDKCCIFSIICKC